MNLCSGTAFCTGLYCLLDLAAVTVVPVWVGSFHAGCLGRGKGLEVLGEKDLADDRS